jgi:hypothetical protein
MSMKAFLKLFNHPAPATSVIVSMKGQGAVSFTLYSGNHCRRALDNLPGLKNIALKFFRDSPIHRRRVTLKGGVSVIDKQISINGNQWNAGSLCEYISTSTGNEILRVGRILTFVVVEYSQAGDLGRRNSTIFVNMERFTHASLSRVGPVGCTHYRVRMAACRTSQVFVHVSTLSTLFVQVPDNRGEAGVAIQAEEPHVYPTGYMYLVPVAKAFSD